MGNPQTTDLRVRDIGLGGIACLLGRRAIQSDAVDRLVKSIKEVGLINPITIRPNNTNGFDLIAGRHRLDAARKLKWESIPAIVLEGITADDAELVEIDENLIRASLSPAEEAAHHARRKQLYEKRYPETKRGAAGGRAKNNSAKPQNADLKGYAADTASKIGKSRDTVERAVRRGKKIPDVADLAGTSLDKGDELDAFGSLTKEVQAELAARAKAGEKVSAKAARKNDAEESARQRKAAYAVEEAETERSPTPEHPRKSFTETFDAFFADIGASKATTEQPNKEPEASGPVLQFLRRVRRRNHDRRYWGAYLQRVR
jgi:ParB family transcriptional regulator, chromosome partitioning protein